MKLHLGCGKRFIPGFIHIDLADFPHITYRQDIRILPMFKDNSIELIYFSHGIEYFDREEVKKVLKEWKRVLKPGGILRLAVPNFQALVEVYQKYKNLDKIIGPLYGRIKIETKKGKQYFYHKTVYDRKSLVKVLKEAGFVKIRHWNWRKSIHKNYDDFSQAYIPHMQKKTGLLISLNIEAVKP